jgi:hypothetical protein
MTDPKINWDAVFLSNYESTVFWDVHWISKARDLYECARKLEPDVLRVLESYGSVSRNEGSKLLSDHYQGVYFMLLSFAVENLLKAALIAKKGSQYREEFRAKKTFPKELQKHDLVTLAQLIGLKFEDGEEDLFRRLTRNAVWHGRYPAPLKYPEMGGLNTFLDGSEHRISWYAASDIERLNALMTGLPARLGIDVRY